MILVAGGILAKHNPGSCRSLRAAGVLRRVSGDPHLGFRAKAGARGEGGGPGLPCRCSRTPGLDGLRRPCWVGYIRWDQEVQYTRSSGGSWPKPTNSWATGMSRWRPRTSGFRSAGGAAVRVRMGRTERASLSSDPSRMAAGRAGLLRIPDWPSDSRRLRAPLDDSALPRVRPPGSGSGPPRSSESSASAGADSAKRAKTARR